MRALAVLILCFSCSAQSLSFGEWELARVIDLAGPTYHVQGVDFDNTTLWLTSVDSNTRRGFLHTFALPTGEKLRTIEIQDAERFHPGGISGDGGSLWIPVAEYRTHSTSVIQKRNKGTLEIESQFRVPDHIGCLAVTPEFVIGGNWDSREFYFWDRSGKLVRQVPNPDRNAYQDMKFEAPYVVASGLLPDHSGAIDWLEFPSLRLVRRVATGNTDRKQPLSREAMAIHGDRLYLVPEDDPSRLFMFNKGRGR